MSCWDTYEHRIETRGGTKRGAAYKREVRFINKRLKDNLSFKSIKLYGQDCGYNITDEEMSSKAITKQLAIIKSDNLNEKYLYSQAGDDIELGALVEWEDNRWLVTEKDADRTVYSGALMEQCNFLLRWVEDDGKIYEQWCIISDGTKYLTGEMEDRHFIATRGDSRIAMVIARNEHTVKFDRKSRFLIDDPESEMKLSYQLTKPMKLGYTFNGLGIFKFVLQEVSSTQDDNYELGIADYYVHFPKENSQGSDDSPESERRSWL